MDSFLLQERTDEAINIDKPSNKEPSNKEPVMRNTVYKRPPKNSKKKQNYEYVVYPL